MSFINKFAVVFIGSVTRVNLVIIGDCIAVIWFLRHIVLHQRSWPHSGHAQISKIVKMRGHTLQVAAVTGQRYGRVAYLLPHSFHHIIIFWTVGKAVGHQQIDHIRTVIATTTIFTFWLQLIFKLYLPAILAQHDCKRLSRCIFQIQIEDKKIGIISFYHLINPDVLGFF